MELVAPKVQLIGHTELDLQGLENYLDQIGADEYKVTAETGAEALVEAAGKACYRSWQADLNPNVTRVRNNNAVYLQNINKIGHGSVIEHCSVSFIFWNVSRVFTHELVRHRIGTAMSQESLRYVRLDKLKFWIPTILKDEDDSGKGQDLVREVVEYLEQKQHELQQIYKIDERKSFTEKKLLTSAFRRIAPIGLATAIVWSMNFRSARHLIQMRTSRHAEEEIRLVFDQVATTLAEKYQAMFGDMIRNEVDGIGEWVSPFAAMPYDGEKINKLVKCLAKIHNDLEVTLSSVNLEHQGQIEHTLKSVGWKMDDHKAVPINA